ncbi:MAG: DMT family transporter [Ignavibacteriales bacterium]|nr:DMT family transporter [Ignavibacteriales bacterium]
MKMTQIKSIALAILAAVLYGISTPFSKILLNKLEPTLIASLLYFGAGIGMLSVLIVNHYRGNSTTEMKLSRKEMPFVIGMIILDIIAPVSLMTGLKLSNASSVSLLNNFEVVATTVIALMFFKENVGKRMWGAIGLITVASIILSVDNIGTLQLSVGSIFVILATVAWGLENNCTRMISLTDPAQIVSIKGFGSGVGALLIYFYQGGGEFSLLYVLLTLLLGFVAYGMSIYVYIRAQSELGAARTSAFYAVAPFIGVIISWAVFNDRINSQFVIALVVMIIGSYFAFTESHGHEHEHLEEEHTHKHNHEDGHHNHYHEFKVSGTHSHTHKHERIKHSHNHNPDMHHMHSH